MYYPRLSKSKSLPCRLPLPYTLGVSRKSCGGGKSLTGNVCDPAFGGGEGTVNQIGKLTRKEREHILFLRGGGGRIPLVI